MTHDKFQDSKALIDSIHLIQGHISWELCFKLGTEEVKRGKRKRGEETDRETNRHTDRQTAAIETHRQRQETRELLSVSYQTSLH